MGVDVVESPTSFKKSRATFVDKQENYPYVRKNSLRKHARMSMIGLDPSIRDLITVNEMNGFKKKLEKKNRRIKIKKTFKARRLTMDFDQENKPATSLNDKLANPSIF